MKRTQVILSLAGLSTLAVFASRPVAAQTTDGSADVATSTAVSSAAASGAVAAPVDTGQGIAFPHYLLDRALEPNVGKDGRIDYVSLKGNKISTRICRPLPPPISASFPVFPIPPRVNERTGKVEESARPTENRNAEMVFWINAYNAHIVNRLAAAFPINSPDEIKDLDTAKVHRVAGQDWSLRDMRKKIGSFDPRALFTLTNGTLGGPLLQPIAYRFSGIDQQLENAVQTFIDDPRNVELLRINNR
jgi:hypothetical protein